MFSNGKVLLLKDVAILIFRNVATLMFRGVAILLFRDVAILMFSDVDVLLLRDVAILMFRDVASEMKLLLDSAARLAPLLPERQRQELDMARRKLLETSRSFSTALKGYFKEPQ